MPQQMSLLETAEHDWHLDERTRAVGRRGLAQARRALRGGRAGGRATMGPGQEARPPVAPPLLAATAA